jgi:glycosyltransferase involved in cell wall biosynthesis
MREEGATVIERHLGMEAPNFVGSTARSLVQLVRAAVSAPLHPGRMLAAARDEVDADVVFIGYLGHQDLATAALLRFLRLGLRRPIVFDPFFSLYDTIVSDRAIISRTSLAARAIRKTEQLLLRQADLLLADTAAHARYYRSLANLSTERVCVVPLGVDEKLFTPRGPAPFVDRPLVLFYGTYIPLHGVTTILEAARLVKTTNIRFRLIGTGQTRASADAFARRHSLGNVEFLDWIPIERLADTIAQAHVVLGIFGTTDKAARVVPTKVYQALSVGRCVVTRDSPAIREMFTPGADLLVCPPGDAQSLATAIQHLTTDAELRLRISLSGAQAVREGFSARAVGRRVLDAVANARRQC